MEKLTVNLKEKSYDIIVDNGSFVNFGVDIRSIYKGEKLVVVTDENLNAIYGEKLKNLLEATGFNVKLMAVVPGEGSKSLPVLQQLYEEFIKFGLTRGDMIVAFGGGVVGDLAGFAAATYLRGVPFIQIPTSLLAQVDSSVGGKVAVDLPQGKNLVGCFYQPKMVLIDPNLLQTLPKKYFIDGMGEVIKYACIKDEALFEELMMINDENDIMNHICKIIFKCCNIKKQIVEVDELDMGLRMILNFGHTIGHGIEKYYNYGNYSHGEAVAMGMYYITKCSEKLGLTEENTLNKLKCILEKYGLPWELPQVELSEIRKIIEVDKKNISGRLKLILLDKIGSSFVKDIDIKELYKYIF
ncbi:3-dehydroquinate synthase [Hathewaya proteolytica DSM 3090]|uniref:3-dehydroquinate synthase n=1 Tax=Hathewaya proteolytica DSM 3090 TaxID=1121331 RepID=A0A1M6QCB3_9CLOT|nr:3-dehydroquinate synthase [Hathewaya proteolytica]SHK17795.1 3-dehydroquinate synthase [Hathewaya proteolytica DSM 3090]